MTGLNETEIGTLEVMVPEIDTAIWNECEDRSFVNTKSVVKQIFENIGDYPLLGKYNERYAKRMITAFCQVAGYPLVSGKSSGGRRKGKVFFRSSG